MDLRRSLDEVSAMYVLEPELRDVYLLRVGQISILWNGTFRRKD